MQHGYMHIALPKGRPKTATVLGRPFGAPFGPLLDPFGAALADDESCLIVKSLVNFSKKQIPKSKRILSRLGQ